MNHSDEMTLLLYLEQQLDADRAREVAAHIASCGSCRALLGALEREGVWLRQTLAAEDEAVPARLLEAPERPSIPWGWITALGLSAGGAYTVWSGIVEPWRAQAAQAGFTQGNLLTMLFFSGAFWKGWDAVRSLMEFAAMATLTVLLSWLLRRHWHRVTAVAFVMSALLCMLALPSPTGAAETKRGDPNFILASGETVPTDLFVLADRTQIDGDVHGDLVVWSREVIVNGDVKGDLLCGAEIVRIIGTVDGNVRCFAQSVDVRGTVARNLMSWSGETNLEDTGRVGGSVTFGSNDATLAGSVGGDVLGGGLYLDVTGKVGGDARLHEDHLTIGSSAEIKGHTRCLCKRDPQIAPGAKLQGSIERIVPKSEARYDQARFYWHRVLLWGIGFVYGLVLLLLIPSFYADTTQACKKYAPAAGFGLLFLFGVPIAAIIACCTIVGLAVGIATILLYGIAFFSSTVFVAGWVGEALLGSKPGMGAAIGRLALGLFILHVLRVLPYVGGWILFVAVFWGFGALVMTIYKRLRPQFATAPAV
jgi:cytoskeletal protein CcmA (bactofilin family)